jgi:hypothetical protein
MVILSRTYEVKVWQWILTWICMIGLMIGGVYGATQYASDQRAQAARDVSIATYQAQLATYQNAVSDRTACIGRAQGRSDIGVLLTGVYNKIDPEKTDPTVNELRGQLTGFVSEADPNQCPPEIPAPNLPPDAAGGG